ncbi:MAG: nickel-dependent lactate racemase [Chloroflexi bacterium]|nr:nickel-dependent lactate racemase [Chloroflexota bacterium]
MESTEVAIPLPTSGGEHTICIPRRRLAEVLAPPRASAQAALAELIHHALASPIGCPALAEQLRPNSRILIVIDDVTRTTPAHAVIPILLEYLTDAGCRGQEITFAVALGTHRPMTEAEIAAKLGADVARRFRVVNTPAQETSAFASIGESWGGAPIEVHRELLAADVVIAIGSVVPHTEAGWSGGAKLILPGLCSERTVTANHVLAAAYAGNALGQDSTPVREQMEVVVARIGLAYSLNLVTTPYGEVVGVFGGHFVAAQRAAVEAARPIFTIPYRERADIVIADAYPAESDLWQASKAIWAGERLVKPGGILIVYASCPEGIGPHGDFLRFLQQEPERTLAELQAGVLADPIAAAIAVPAARMLAHMRLVVVSPGLEPAQFGEGAIVYAHSLQQAVDAALTQAAPAARVSVLTHAGYSHPVERR